MTRQDFIDNVNDWWELKDFCSDNECDVCDEIYDESGMDEEINYAVSEYHGDYSWYDLREMLDSIPSGYDYYRQNGSFDWDGMDNGDDFRDYKDAVIEWMDDGGYWDDEDDGREEYLEEASTNDEEYNSEDDAGTIVEDEDFSVGDLIGMCSVTFVNIQQDALRHEKETNEAFRQYVGVNMPKVLK